MKFNPYLFFGGACEEALQFYRHALGAEVTSLMRFKDAPDRSMVQPGTEEKIMHGSFRVGGQDVFVSDGRCEGKGSFEGFALSLMADSAGEAERLFGALADGGTVRMKLEKTFFAERFGMVADRFGVTWMVHVGT
jgi:PhnB protein